jgi:hypothetical protein
MKKMRRAPGSMHHYTNKKGYNGIRAVPTWCFKAARQRRADKPFGAYFTTLLPSAPNFVRRVRLPRAKREYRFSFVDVGDLTPLPGPGGRYVFYSPADYRVGPPRQQYSGFA